MKGRAFLLKELIKRDFQGRYAGSLLGFFWSFALPLWQLLLFSFVFAKIMKIRVALDTELTENFGIFLFCGLLPWMAFQEGITRASTAIVDNAAVIKKARLPLMTLVLAPAASALVHEGIAATVFVLILAFLGELGGASLLILCVALPLQLALTVGLGLLTCAIHTFFRDTAQVLGMLMMGWFYLTPIVYSPGMIPPRAASVLELNPMATLVLMYRQAFLGGSLAAVEGLGRLVVVAAVVLCAGLWLFGRLEKHFVDQV